MIGIFQRLVLRKYAFRRWVLATTVGVGGAGLVLSAMLGFFVLSDTATPDSPRFGYLINLLLMAFPASVGTMQWLVLRRTVSRAGWWVLANIVGFIAMDVMRYVLGSIMSDIRTVVMEGQNTVMWILELLLYGSITGGMLVWLLRQSVPIESVPQQAAE